MLAARVLVSKKLGELWIRKRARFAHSKMMAEAEEGAQITKRIIITTERIMSCFIPLFDAVCRIREFYPGH